MLPLSSGCMRPGWSCWERPTPRSWAGRGTRATACSDLIQPLEPRQDTRRIEWRGGGGRRRRTRAARTRERWRRLIRIPAAILRHLRIRASFGLVPQYPPSAVGDLSHLGPLTRTVRDAAMMLNAMAGADGRDRLS